MTQLTRTLEILDRLIAFPTISQTSNLDLIDWVEDLLTTAGFTVTRIPSPDGQKAGLFARIGPGTDGGVCLSAHTDVVPVEGQPWTRPPFELTSDTNRVYGRGTTDMKGFLASALAIAEQAGKTTLNNPLTLSISYDEEIGCVGIRQMMPDLAPLIGTPSAVIVGEPTSMQIATGHKGKTALKIHCHGQSGHSALAPQFTNAIHVAASFTQAVQTLQNQLANGPRDPAYAIPYSTLHIGRIAGGRALNIVPDATQLEMEFRHLTSTPAETLRAEIDTLAQRVSRDFPDVPPITVEETNAYPGLDTDPANPVVNWAQSMTNQTTTTKVPFGTEAGFFASLDLPTLVIGPGNMESDGHKPDEGLDLSQLQTCNEMMDRVLADLSA